MGGATLGARVSAGAVPAVAGSIGVFGGTFDPIHHAHLAVAQGAAEAFLDFATWREPRRILELARLAVAPRDGYPTAGMAFMTERFPDLVDRVTFLDGPRIRLSASELRERAAAGRSLRYLVPDAVAAYIDDHGRYQNSRRTVET